MIEPEAVVDPEPAAPALRSRRRRRTGLAAVTALAVAAGAIAMTAGDRRSEPKPLALIAGDITGDSAGGRAEMITGAGPAVGPAVGAGTRPAHPSGGWGLKFDVAGDLPDLPDQAPAWPVRGAALDRAAVARIAGALGLSGVPEQRDGGWIVDAGDRTLNAFPGGDTWSVSLFRSRVAGPDDGGLVPDDRPTGPPLSTGEAERRVRELLDRMGAPAGSWRYETTGTEIGIGWACAAPAPPAMTAGERRKLDLEKLRQVGAANAATTAAMPAPEPGPIPADQPAPDGSVGSCPPPPEPVEGFVVALYPWLDGVRADWPVWHVTLRSDGRVESLSGSWVTFERGDDYKLRGVSAAREELQSPAESPGRLGEGVVADPAGPTITADAPAAPQVVMITGVEPALLPAPVFADGRARLHLVPAYRFVGRFEGGAAWETLVIALHPDAVTPPPGLPVADDLPARTAGGGSTGVDKAVPPMPAGAEPFIGDPDSPR